MPKLSDLISGSPQRLRLSDVASATEQPGFMGRFFEAVAPSRVENIPSVVSQEFMSQTGGPMAQLGYGAKQVPRSLFGSDESMAEAAMQAVPGAQLVQDEQGRPVIQTPDGQRFYPNRPGLDPDDVFRFGGQAAAFAPAAATGAIAPTVLGRAALTGAASGATDVVGQLAAGQFKPEQTAATAALGAGAEFVAPVVSAVYRGAKRALRPGQAIAKAREVLAGSGRQMAPETVEALSRQLDEMEAGARPDELLSEQEFGLRFTQGQKLAAAGDKRAFGQLTREDMLRNWPGRAGQEMRTVGTANEANVQRALEGISGRVAGGPVRDPIGAVEQATGRVRSEAEALKERIGEAYGAVGDTSAYLPAEALGGFPRRARAALEGIAVTERLTPAAVDALETIGKRFGGQTTALNLKNFETTRRELLSMEQSAKRGSPDRLAVRKLVNELDDWLGDTAAQGLVNGDEQAIALIKEARSRRAEYGRRFGDDKLSKIVNDMIDGQAPPEQLANAIYGASQISNTAAINALRRVKQAIGEGPELQQLKAAVLTRAATRKTGDRVGLEALESNLKTLLTQRPTLMREILNPEELATVKRLTTALNTLNAKAIGRSSGTAERALSYIGSLSRGVPFLSDMLRDLGAQRGVSRALSPLRQTPTRTVPALAQPGVPAAYGAITAGLDQDSQ